VKFHKIAVIIPAVVLALALLIGSSLLLRMFFFIALVLLASYLWAVFGSRGIHVSVDKLPEHCQVGGRFNHSVTVENKSKYPHLFLRAGEQTDMPGYQNARILNLLPGRVQTWQSVVDCTHRGLYNIGPFRLTASDPFGIFSRHSRIGETSKVLVYPRTIDLPLFKSVSINESGYASGYQSISQISPNASSVREFASGDSLHHIHWHSVAHTGRLMVKMFDADRSYNSSKIFWLVIDLDEQAQAGLRNESTEEYAVSIASSLIKKHIENGMSVGLIAAGDREHFSLPARGESHLWNLLGSLAVARAKGDTSLGESILGKMENFKDNPVLMIVATSTSRELLEALRKLKNKVESVVVILLNTPSFGGTHHIVNNPHNLTLSGAQVYTIRQGDELSKALDSRVSVWQARYG
jgi:uncharacterized protein (DUF58 family)